MSINPLNDISRVYLEQVAAVEEGVRPTPVEKPLDKAAFKKRRRSLAGKEKSAEARSRGHEGKEWYNSGRTYSPDEAKRSRANMDDEERRTRHRSAVDPDNEDDNNYSADKTKNPKKLRKQKAMGESAVPGKPAERLGAVTAIPKSEQDAARERLLAKTKAKREKMKTEDIDVSDIINERSDEPGERDSNSDVKFHNRSLKNKQGKRMYPSGRAGYARRPDISKDPRWGSVDEVLDPVGQEDADIDNDGDTDKSDKYLHNRRKTIGKAIKKKSVKEGFSNWRQELELFELTDKKDETKITEKNIDNSRLIKINPKLAEAVDEIGGTLLEMVEVDEFDYVVEGAYLELLEEGYGEDEIEDALDYALTEAKVTFGHDTGTSTEKKKKSLLNTARQKLSGAKTAVKAAVARGARKVAKGALGVARKMEGGSKAPKTAERKPSTYRGAGAGQKEKVSSGSYTPPAKKKVEKPADPWKGSSTVPQKPKPKPKAEKPSDPWEGSSTTPPKAKSKKAAAPKQAATNVSKKKKKSKLDNLLADIRNEQVQLDEKSLSRAQQRFMGMVYATKKGKMNAPSSEVAKAASGMSEKEAKKFAKTKHKGLPEKKVQEQQQTPLSPQELQVQRQRAQLDTRLAMLRKQTLSKMKKPEKEESPNKKTANEMP